MKRSYLFLKSWRRFYWWIEQNWAWKRSGGAKNVTKIVADYESATFAANMVTKFIGLRYTSVSYSQNIFVLNNKKFLWLSYVFAHSTSEVTALQLRPPKEKLFRRQGFAYCNMHMLTLPAPRALVNSLFSWGLILALHFFCRIRTDYCHPYWAFWRPLQFFGQIFKMLPPLSATPN